jgi:hypothetical protein
MSAAEYAAAAPTCMAKTMTRRGQHGIHHRCAKQMRYHVRTNMWFCFGCGRTLEGEKVAARQCGY